MSRAWTNQRSRRRGRRGQAMVEYSFINFVLVIALAVSVNVKWFRGNGGPADRRLNLIELFLRAYQNYYDSFYVVMAMPFP